MLPPCRTFFAYSHDSRRLGGISSNPLRRNGYGSASFFSTEGTSSFHNQGLNYYIPVKGTTVLKNVISIPSNSDVYRAYFQSRDFTVLSDAYAIRWKYTEAPLSPKQYLFFVQCINKVTDLPTFSYKNKLGGWNVVKDLYIALPIKDREIDLPFMDLLISALQKLIIKDVVLYAEAKVNATKNGCQ